MRRNDYFSIGFALIAWFSAGQLAQSYDRDAFSAAMASITREELKTYVDTLADDTFEGRETGSRGGRAAGNFVLQAFERLGLPAGDSGTYLQSFSGASRNVLALVEGSDPRLKDEVIVVGAHYDHVGYGRSNNSFGPLGYIHNGADDNASGVAGMLEVLEAVKRLPMPPKRSVLFAAWDSEEGGLNGSRHWVSRPTLPLARVKLGLNMDMIGRMRNGRLEVLAARTGAGLRRMVSEANGAGPPAIDFNWKLKADSDHWSFIERRIPALMFHTGLHSDYHRPSDDAHLINTEGLTQATKLIFSMLVLAADAEQLPAFRDAARQESPANALAFEQAASPPPPRFGMPFRVEMGENVKFFVTAITPGSPADRGGLKAGDELLEFQGWRIDDEARLRLELLAARGECAFRVQRPGSETPLLLKVTPSGEAIRVGITWRMDDGEPGTVIVSQAIYGSAAHAAGLRVGDRVYSVGGQSFKTQDEFIRLLTNAQNPLTMAVERDGTIHEAMLKLVEREPEAE